MELRCLGSSSTGNCYLLENETECLVLEAGLPFREVKKVLGFNISKIAGLLVTHEHGDHFGHVREYLKAGIPVRASAGTWRSLDCEIEISTKTVKPGYWYKLGGFIVTPFPVVHDAAEPLGFIVRHHDIGNLLFASDTEYIKHNFKGLKLNHIMVECNYSQKIIDGRVHSGDTNKGLRDRVLQSHMELETCKAFIEANKTIFLDTVALLHLSDGNSNEIQFTKEIQEVAGPSVHIYAANKGTTVNLDIIPF
jgi:phosphoribosyl 1,2-cyclic phosphodiesterase